MIAEGYGLSVTGYSQIKTVDGFRADGAADCLGECPQQLSVAYRFAFMAPEAS